MLHTAVREHRFREQCRMRHGGFRCHAPISVKEKYKVGWPVVTLMSKYQFEVSLDHSYHLSFCETVC